MSGKMPDLLIKVEPFVKSTKAPISVIPVKTGIQCFYLVKSGLDSRLRGNDEFLRIYQSQWVAKGLMV